MTLIGAPSVSQQGLYFSLKAVSLLLSTVIIGFLTLYNLQSTTKIKVPTPQCLQSFSLILYLSYLRLPTQVANHIVQNRKLSGLLPVAEPRQLDFIDL